MKDIVARYFEGKDSAAHIVGEGLVTTRRPRQFVSVDHENNDRPVINSPLLSPSKSLKGDSRSDCFEEPIDIETLSTQEQSFDGSEQFVIENTAFVSRDSQSSYERNETSRGKNSFHAYDDIQSDMSSTTETSSLAYPRNLREDFGHQKKKQFDKSSFAGSTSREHKTMQPRTQLAKAEVSSSRRKVDPAHHRVQATPVRILRPRHSDVQATNDGYKSVAKLAAWLEDDPTKSKKEVIQIRRGANIIAKARAFDKGLANVVIEQNHIRAGCVQSEKHRLEEESDEEELQCSASTVSVAHKKEWLANAFKQKCDTIVDRARTEIVTDREKRDEVALRAKQIWRQRASTDKKMEEDPCFRAKEIWKERTTGGESLKPNKEADKASAPVSAVQRFQRNTDDGNKKLVGLASSKKASKNGVQLNFDKEPDKTPALILNPKNSGSRGYQQNQTLEKLAVRKPISNDTVEEPSKSGTSLIRNPVSGGVKPKVDASSSRVVKATCENNEKEGFSQGRSPTSDDEQREIPLNFSEARKLLVQRSKQNGHNVQILTKVAMKKAKFEKLERDNQSRTFNGARGKVPSGVTDGAPLMKNMG